MLLHPPSEATKRRLDTDRGHFRKHLHAGMFVDHGPDSDYFEEEQPAATGVWQELIELWPAP